MHQIVELKKLHSKKYQLLVDFCTAKCASSNLMINWSTASITIEILLQFLTDGSQNPTIKILCTALICMVLGIYCYGSNLLSNKGTSNDTNGRFVTTLYNSDSGYVYKSVYNVKWARAIS